MIKRLLNPCSLSFLLLLTSSLLHAAVTAHLTPQPAALNETLTLTLTSDRPHADEQPDLNGLDPLFTIISSEHRLSYSLVNGKMQHSNEWVFVLFPKKAGTLQLPPIQLGADKTTPLTVTIQAAGTQLPASPLKALSDHTPELFIRTELSPQKGLLNEQLIYTVQVYHQRPLLDVDYTAPHAETMLFIPLKPLPPEQVLLHEQPYVRETLRYACFPTKSGQLTISPPQLKGLIDHLIPHPAYSQGKPMTLTIQAPPSTATLPFLPSMQLSISEDWEPSLQAPLHAGDLIKRTLHIQAAGLPAAFLPTPALEGEGFQVYPAAQPILHNEETASGITGHKTLTVTYWFQTPGVHALPALTIKWFDPLHQTPHETTLPARTLTLLPSSAPSSIAAPAAPKAPPTPAAPLHRDPWMISTIVLLVLFFSKALYTRLPWRQIRKRPRFLVTSSGQPSLKRACQQNDAKAAQQALLLWGQRKWPGRPCTQIYQLRRYCEDPALKQALAALEHALYRAASEGTAWEGKALWQAFQAYTPPKRPRARKKTKKSLNGLNPTGRGAKER